jgi:heme/copper-type cytochrome/quinol oxidase subunit 2
VLSRSQKTVSLIAALGGFLFGMAIFAGPAMALSLNPDAGSPGISEVNEFHTIIFIVILIAIVVVNLAILKVARPRQRHVPSQQKRSDSGGTGIGRGLGIFLVAVALVLLAVALAFFDTLVFAAALVLIAVGSLLALRAVRAGEEDRAQLSEEASERRGRLSVGLGLAALAVAIFVTATVYSGDAREIPVSSQTVAGMSDDEQLEIRATGQQWLWRFDYPNQAFSYHRLVVPAGVTVALRLNSTDVIHGWNVPSLTGKADAIPGQNNQVHFRADEEGIYKGHSSIFSGQGYNTMEAEVEVISPEEYEEYIAHLKADIQTAQDEVEKVNVNNLPG